MSVHVHIKHEISFHLLHECQAGGVSAVVEIGDQLSAVGHKLQELLERRVLHHLGRELGAVEGCQCTQTPIDGDVLRRDDLVEGNLVGMNVLQSSLVALLLLLKLHRSEFRCSHLVLPAVEISQPARSPQLRNGARVFKLVHLLSLGDVIENMGEVSHFDGNFDNLQAHVNRVLRRGPIVSCADKSLQRFLQVSHSIMLYPNVVMPHPDLLLDRVELVLTQLHLEPF
mmetsp:Transcript_18135/g.41142  ORF Transcript_18135/g.41142 Transcript_18135/m.41142 type:complete len:227 (+) Transcript_18135:1599-2279(+)